MEYHKYCPFHGPLVVVPDSKDAPLGCPPLVRLGPSSIGGAGTGVWSARPLPAGLRFGPYRGRASARPPASGVYVWQVLVTKLYLPSLYNTKYIIYSYLLTAHCTPLTAGPLGRSRPALLPRRGGPRRIQLDALHQLLAVSERTELTGVSISRPNLLPVSIHHTNSLYNPLVLLILPLLFHCICVYLYRTTQNIYPNTELLVWYGPQFGRTLGIDVPNYFKASQGECILQLVILPIT